MKFTNNSCTRITRIYAGFELDIPGNKTVTLPVPAHYEENVRKFLAQHHPAVMIVEEGAVSDGEKQMTEASFTAPVNEPVTEPTALTSRDTSIVDINAEEDSEPVTETESLEELPKEIGPDDVPEVPEVAPVKQDKPPKKQNKRGGKR